MAKLQAATVSNKPVRKRKRKDTEDVPLDTTSPTSLESAVEQDQGIPATTDSITVLTKENDGGKKPRRVSKGKATPALARNESSFTNPVTSTIPWPSSFQTLEKTHRALNLVYTFCSTRKHLATTFDNLKTAVEGHIKRELRVEDVAQIVALRPNGMNFSYVDEAMLQLDVRGAERDETFKGGRAKNWHAAGPAPDASVGGLTGVEGLGYGEGADGEGKEVLLFEFIDGDLKRQVQSKKTGEAVKATRKLKDEELKMPVFSQKQMMNLIEKRNTKFVSAINAFLNRCEANGVGAEASLLKEAEPLIPIPSISRSSTPKPDHNVLPKSIPKERASISSIITEIKESEWYTGQIVPDGHRVFDPKKQYMEI
ncbi:DEAD/DEAH box helicase [Botrytis cinerea]